MTPAGAAWRQRGHLLDVDGHGIFVVDIPAADGTEGTEPLVVLHGFPTSSGDFAGVVDALAARRRVVLFDMLGYGHSDKPDRAYTVGLQADVAAGVLERLDIGRCALLTHDVGDTVGGELLARQLEGWWPVEVTRRVLTNGSIYIGLAHLTEGQQLLLSLPDERLADPSFPDRASLAAGIAVTFSPSSAVPEAEVEALADAVLDHDGQTLLPRLVRYIEERRRDERRFTGAIETHPSPLTVVWGADDPVAVPAMVDRLVTTRPATPVTMLDGVGHYPMLEAPGRFVAAVAPGLG